jgi:asparagine synthase (glutamine-hydrolysing)
MCGLVVYINKVKNIENENKNKCLRSLDIIKHRGPDTTSFEIYDNVFMGHNLLSITGDNVAQPIEYNNTSLIHNGEFYHYQDYPYINSELKSDSYLPLIQYEYYGDIHKKSMSELHGEFSFVLYDPKKNIVKIARDRFGVKPIYIYESKSEIIITSEIKAFKPFFDLELDDKCIHQVLSMQYHRDSSTLFKNIKQIKPGHLYTLDLNSYTIKKEQYWDLEYKENIDQDHLLYSKLKSAINVRVQTKREKGYTLSGGIDSAAILALSDDSEKDSYTMSFVEDDNYNEKELASEMANKVNATNKSLDLTNLDLFKNMKTAIYHAEDVAMNLHVASKFMMFQEMKKDNKRVSLSGEGADEIFLGYAHLQKELNNDYDVPDYLKGVHTATDSLAIEGFDIPEFLKAKINMGYNVHKSFIANEFNKKYTVLEHLIDIEGEYELPKKQIYASTYLWIKLCLSNYILVALGDKLEMANSIEGRVPFLDTYLVEYVNNLQINLKNKKQEKKILREVLKGYITENIRNKTKHPLLSPPLITGSEDFIVQELCRLKSYGLSYFDNDKLDIFINSIKIKKMNMEIYPGLMVVLSILYLYETMIME